MDLGNLIRNYGEAVAMILFGIGFSNLLLQKNLIKKIIDGEKGKIANELHYFSSLFNRVEISSRSRL